MPQPATSAVSTPICSGATGPCTMISMCCWSEHDAIFVEHQEMYVMALRTKAINACATLDVCEPQDDSCRCSGRAPRTAAWSPLR